MIPWDIARSSAFVAFGCYTLVVSWGILLAARAWRPPAPQLAFHRFLSTLGLVAVAVHVGALMSDGYAHVTWRSLVALDPRPGVRLGAIALWLIVALPLSFQLKRRRLMSHRAWRFLHRFGYATWVLALCHGVLSGSDTASPFARLAYGLGAMLVVGAAWWRWFELPVPGSPRPGGSPRPSEGSA